MRSLRPLARRHGLDALIVAAALASALAVAVAGHAGDAPRSTRWFAVPAVAAIALSLLARRRRPFAAAAGLWLLGAASSFVDGRLAVFSPATLLAGLAAALLLGHLRDERQARAGLVVTVAAAAIVVSNDPRHSAGEFLFVPALVAIAWVTGYALRDRARAAADAEERAERAERERESAARVAVAEERARIARELHDVVAHAVSVMVLQVGAVRHRLPDDRADDRATLVGVEGVGRHALADMRRLLGALRRDDEAPELGPQPSLAHLDDLLEHVRGAGLPVEVRVAGEPVALPAPVDLSAYRIVQEGLTNALRHARATRADVTIRYGPEAVEVEVRDDGAGHGSADGQGHGLVGIRERVKIFGGEMTAGPDAGRGFVLRTRLPLSGDAP